MNEEQNYTCWLIEGVSEEERGKFLTVSLGGAWVFSEQSYIALRFHDRYSADSLRRTLPFSSQSIKYKFG